MIGNSSQFIVAQIHLKFTFQLTTFPKNCTILLMKTFSILTYFWPHFKNEL